MRKLTKLSVLAFLSALIFGLAGCSHLAYQVDVQQGNVIDQSQAEQLKIGMTKEVVRNILGSAVLCSSFNDNELHYIYSSQKNGGKITMRQLNLQFSKNRLIKIMDSPEKEISK